VLMLTAAGKKAQTRAEQAVDVQALEFFGRLSESERQELHQLLTRLIS
jgi:DNA-binding MarR family transcriptional regulator